MLGLAGIISIIAVLLMIVSFVAGIWLIVVAFKRSVLWGLLAMLVPFASLVFTIKYWQDARKPFLTSVATGIGAFVFFLMGAGFAVKAVTPEMAQQMRAEAERQAALEGSVSNNQGPGASAEPRTAMRTDPMPPVDAMPGSTSHATDPSTARTLRLLDAMPQSAEGGQESPNLATSANAGAPGHMDAKKPVYDVDAVTRDGFAPVALTDAGQLIGKRVKLVTTGGQVHVGEILRADGNVVSLERWLRGGSAVLDFSKTEIESLHVRVN